MYDMGLRSNTAYKKSARIVGEVLGKYHPHGDAAVYDTMAHLGQDFQSIGTFNFDASLGLEHDLIDPSQSYQHTAMVYPQLLDLIIDMAQ